MGFVASAVESVVDVVSDAVEVVGDAVEDVAGVVGDAVEIVGNTVEAVIEDPVPTLLSIAGASIGIPPAVTSAAITASRGGDLSDIALSAGTSYVAGQAGQFASSSIAPTISSSITQAGVEGATNQVITNAATNALVGGVTAELRGGNFSDGAISGATGSLISSGVSNVAGDYLDPATQKIVSSGLTAAALGGDPATAISKGLVSAGSSLVGGLFSDPNSRDVEAQAGGFYGGAAPSSPSVIASDTEAPSPLQYADASNIGGTRLDVVGSPFYQGMEGSESVQAPEGMRLATYDEANQGDLIAETLPDGRMAFVVPDVQEQTQEEPVAPEVVPVDELINQIVNNPVTEETPTPPDQTVTPELAATTQQINNDLIDQQIASLNSNFTNQITGLTTIQQQEIADRVAQGESLEQAINNVQTGLTDQITGVQTGLTDQFQTGLESLGSQFTDQLSGVQEGFQTQFDQLSDAQKDQALALLNQGQSLEQAISNVQTGLTEQFQTGINSLETNMNAYMQAGLTRDQALQLAIDDLGNDVTQSNEDINQQLAELGLETGQSFQDVNQQITNLGGGLSGLAQNVATGQAQTERQLQGLNTKNAMEKIAGIFAEPNQKYDSPIKPYLQPGLISTGQAPQQQGKDYSQIIGELSSVLAKRGYKVGGEVRTEDNPVEYVAGPEDRYYARHMKRGFAVNGPGTGQSDDIPTMLADGEYVIDADTVAALGDGSSKAGAAALDKFRENIRAHKRSAPTDKIPPKAKSPLEYLKTAQKPKGSKHG